MKVLPSLPSSSPWYKLSEFAKPNVKWCESMSDGYFAEPVNTLSNLAYIVAAIYLFRVYSQQKNPALKYFMRSTLFLGLGSFIYHMTYSYTFQIFDFLGMFFIFGTMISLNLVRMNAINFEGINKSFLSIVLGSGALFALLSILKLPVQIIIVMLVLSVIITEFKARKSHRVERPGHFNASLALLGGAVTFTVLDVTRTWCHPNSLLQGHSIWHLLTALALVQMGLYYNQWDFSKDSQ